jgi:DNA polymerase elongation subunit (family B)
MLNDVPTIRLFGVTDRGKSIVVFDDSMRPYFYVEPKPDLPKKDIDNLQDRLFSLEVEGRKPDMVEPIKRKILGRETVLFRVTATNPSDVSLLRDFAKEWSDVKGEYEYAISFYRRYLIDKEFKPARWLLVEGKKYKSSLLTDISVKADRLKELKEFEPPKLRMLAFDIEVVEENGEETIAMLSMKDDRGFQRVISTQKIALKDAEKVGSERDIILRFIHLMRERNPDLILGYNTDRYDMAKLNDKATKYGLGLVLGRDNRPVFFRSKGRISAAHVRGRLHLDLYDFIEHILSANMTSEVLTLDMVSRELIGEGKKEMPWREMEQVWKTGTGLDKVAQHCLKDSELTLKLGKHIVPLIFQFSRLTGLTPFDCCRVTYSQMVEGLLMRKAYEAGEVILNRPKFDEVLRRRKTEPYEGGYVQTPKKGIYENIVLFDFRSLYPSIIVTFNISPETLDCSHSHCQKNRPPEGDHNFCTDREGFLPSILKELIGKRAATKKQMNGLEGQELSDMKNRQQAMKILTNSFYGYLGYASSRWYSRMCAMAAASYGRFYIKQVLEMAQKDGFDVIYGDTDSLFVKSKTKKEAREFLKKINGKLPGVMEMEFRGMYKRGLFMEAQTGLGAKKKYALLDENDNLVVRGLETRRRDWSSIAKDTQERVVLAVLRERSPSIAMDIVAETVKRLKQEKVNMEDLIIYTQLTKPLGAYEQIGPHVAAARKMQESGATIKEGMTIAYIITKGTGSISDRAVPADEATNYDPEYYIDNQVIPAAMRVLSALDITKEELLKTEDQKSLTGFFPKR